MVVNTMLIGILMLITIKGSKNQWNNWDVHETTMINYYKWSKSACDLQ